MKRVLLAAATPLLVVSLSSCAGLLGSEAAPGEGRIGPGASTASESSPEAPLEYRLLDSNELTAALISPAQLPAGFSLDLDDEKEEDTPAEGSAPTETDSVCGLSEHPFFLENDSTAVSASFAKGSGMSTTFLAPSIEQYDSEDVSAQAFSVTAEALAGCSTLPIGDTPLAITPITVESSAAATSGFSGCTSDESVPICVTAVFAQEGPSTVSIFAITAGIPDVGLVATQLQEQLERYRSFAS